MSKEAMTLALEALETAWYHVGTFAPTDDAIELYDQARTSLRQAIAKAEKQEPVAWLHKETALLRKETNKPKGADWDADHWTPLYTTPQPAQKPWVGLTDEEIATTADYFKDAYGFTQGVLWAEAKLKEKNNG